MKIRSALSILFITLSSMFIYTGCTSAVNDADLVFKNGFIYTVDKSKSIAEAVAVKDGRIVFTGSVNDAGQYIGDSTKVIDLEGRMMLPGFIDSHCHAISAVKQLYEVKLNNLKTVKDIQEAVLKFRKENPGAENIKGRGWSNTMFGKTGPDKKLIDEIINDIPVALASEDGHSKWVNSKTLELAGITSTAADPEGGVIERYKNTNEPSGTLRENAASLVSPIFPYYGFDQLRQGLIYYQDMAVSFGITASHDAYLDVGIDEIPAYRSLEKENLLKMRFDASLYVGPEKDVEQVKALIEERDSIKGSLFIVNSAKIFIDGVVEGSTAYLTEPYEHLPGSKGTLLWDTDRLNRVCSELDKNGFRIHVHSIGDAATKTALDAFEFVQSVNGKRDSRNAITHLQLVQPEDITRFKELGVVAVTQPYWFKKDSYYYNMQVPYLGLQRAEKEYPMKSFFDAGVVVASSSDYPVTIPCDPLTAIQTGITRLEKGVTDTAEVLWPEERVTLEQMIESFTINGAYANFLENETGSIEKGKSADLIILDNNLFNIPPEEISKTKVLFTYFRGKKVFGE